MLERKIPFWPVVLVLCGCTKAAEVKTGGKAPEAVFRSDGEILDAKFDLSAEIIVAASADGTVRRWNVKMGTPLAEPIKVVPPFKDLRE